MSSKPKQTMYNTRSCTHARAHSVSTPAHKKNVKVRDDFGNLIINLLSSVKTPAEGPRSPAEPPNAAGSPLTSEGRSYETENEIQPALRPIRSYSDVVFEIPTAENIPAPVEKSTDIMSYETASENEGLTSQPEDNDDRSWSTVARKCNRKTIFNDVNKSRAKRPNELTKEQKKVVSAAEQQLTEDECTRVNRRKYSVRHDCGNDTESPGEGPSKGKGPDPWNWGAMNLEEEELDMEAQRAALESYKLAKQMAGESESEDPSRDEPGDPRGCQRGDNDQATREEEAVKVTVAKAEEHLRKEYERKLKELTATIAKGQLAMPQVKQLNRDPIKTLVDKVVNPTSDRQERRHTPQAMEPVHQVALKSYIGQASGRIGCTRTGSGDSDSSLDLSYDSSDSSDNESSSTKSQMSDETTK
ncbi:uncharacterized protein EDB91DRAFT_1274903 [Suillus paluster]|uniref:uncharacterized protein n=1 Tax=Suillus paluster TaxID=48578 RepID=UPI001B87CB29|nr:uncharacterized protein EDB91DRAFT_1274903 [Suillus paluster]KAG1721725.1 hypothetical protein EDB91DRAFT_1274903 [Suillus paluster]